MEPNRPAANDLLAPALILNLGVILFRKVAWDGPSRGVTSSSCSAVDQLIPRQQSAVDQLSSARPGGADDGEAER